MAMEFIPQYYIIYDMNIDKGRTYQIFSNKGNGDGFVINTMENLGI